MSKRKYESLIVINTKGKEDSIDGMISEIGKQMEEEGVRLEQVDRIGRREFPYGSKGLDAGFFVNFQFEAEISALEKLNARMRLNEDVHQQHVQRLA